MKNKIGILENDIYIFPIVNSVILLSASLSKHVLHTGIYGTFFDPGFKVQILDYYMNNWNEINNSIFNSGLKIIW